MALGEVLLYIGRSLATWITKPGFSVVSTMIFQGLPPTSYTLYDKCFAIKDLSKKTLIGKKIALYIRNLYFLDDVFACFHSFVEVSKFLGGN